MLSSAPLAIIACRDARTQHAILSLQWFEAQGGVYEAVAVTMTPYQNPRLQTCRQKTSRLTVPIHISKHHASPLRRAAHTYSVPALPPPPAAVPADMFASAVGPSNAQGTHSAEPSEANAAELKTGNLPHPKPLQQCGFHMVQDMLWGLTQAHW